MLAVIEQLRGELLAMNSAPNSLSGSNLDATLQAASQFLEHKRYECQRVAAEHDRKRKLLSEAEADYRPKERAYLDAGRPAISESELLRAGEIVREHSTLVSNAHSLLR